MAVQPAEYWKNGGFQGCRAVVLARIRLLAEEGGRMPRLGAFAWRR
jgi:hypothetical protein